MVIGAPGLDGAKGHALTALRAAGHEANFMEVKNSEQAAHCLSQVRAGAADLVLVNNIQYLLMDKEAGKPGNQDPVQFLQALREAKPGMPVIIYDSLTRARQQELHREIPGARIPFWDSLDVTARDVVGRVATILASLVARTESEGTVPGGRNPTGLMGPR
jgi:hypothetical protein